MTSKVVRDSIINRVQTIITNESWPATLLDIENKRDKPPKTGDFLAVQFLGSEEIQITTGAPGANTYRETGDFIIYYATASGIGANDPLDRLELIRADFRATIIDHVRIDGVNPPDTSGGDLTQINGNWWAATILISYEYDARG